ncbi:MAG: DUF935 family protein [Syntrophobacteraceae bacterium]
MYPFKNYAMKNWISFAEVYGMSLRVGKYEPGLAGQTGRRSFRQCLDRVHHNDEVDIAHRIRMRSRFLLFTFALAGRKWNSRLR